MSRRNRLVVVLVASPSGFCALMAGCGPSPPPPTSCDIECQQARAADQQVADSIAWETESKDEQDHVTATLNLEGDAQLRLDAPRAIAYDTCERKTFDSSFHDVCGVKSLLRATAGQWLRRA